MKKEPKTPEEAQSAARKALDEGRVVMAPTDEVEALQPYIKKIVRACAEAMGEDPDSFEPWVSDESAVSDFAPLNDGDKSIELFFKRVSSILGVEVKRGDSGIVELAKRMMN